MSPRYGPGGGPRGPVPMRSPQVEFNVRRLPRAKREKDRKNERASMMQRGRKSERGLDGFDRRGRVTSLFLFPPFQGPPGGVPGQPLMPNNMGDGSRPGHPGMGMQRMGPPPNSRMSGPMNSPQYGPPMGPRGPPPNGSPMGPGGPMQPMSMSGPGGRPPWGGGPNSSQGMNMNSMNSYSTSSPGSYSGPPGGPPGTPIMPSPQENTTGGDMYGMMKGGPGGNMGGPSMPGQFPMGEGPGPMPMGPGDMPPMNGKPRCYSAAQNRYTSFMDHSYLPCTIVQERVWLGQKAKNDFSPMALALFMVQHTCLGHISWPV